MGILKGSFTTFLLLLLRGGPEPGVKLGSEDSGRQGPGRSERSQRKDISFRPRSLGFYSLCSAAWCCTVLLRAADSRH